MLLFFLTGVRGYFYVLLHFVVVAVVASSTWASVGVGVVTVVVASVTAAPDCSVEIFS